MPRKLPPFAAAAAALALLFGSAPLAADRYEDAYTAAQANMATAEGRAYADLITARLDEKKLRDALGDCAETASVADLEPFTMVLEVTGDGRATQVLLRPPTTVAVCLRWVVRETALPRPPSAGYWVSTVVDVKRAPGAPIIPTAGVATATVPPTPTPAAPPKPAASPRPASVTPLPTPTSPPAAAVAPSEGIHVDPRQPDLATLRRTLAASAAAIGPLLAQSDGVAADDARLEPYWSLAEELDRPIAIALGPEAAGKTSARYRVALGDPLKLEAVLARHPKLRIIVTGAGWPFGDAMVGLMWRYPQVSVDIRPLTRVLPDAEVQAYVRRLADAGFAERILK